MEAVSEYSYSCFRKTLEREDADRRIVSRIADDDEHQRDHNI